MKKCAVLFSVIAFLSQSAGYNLYAQEEDVQLAQAAANPAQALPAPVGIEGKISLDLRNIEVVDALKFLAMKAGLNIVTTKNVVGRVTLMVDNVAVRDIFDIMLRSNGLAYAQQGNIYNVMSEDEYKLLYGRRFSDIRQVKTFRLQYAIPEQAFSLLDTLKTEIGRVLVEPDSGTVLIMDTPDNIGRIEEALATLEQKNLLRVFTLKYAKAKEVEEQLKIQLDTRKVGFVKADERSNQVTVQALPDRMEEIEKLITALDRKTKEVLIDTKIIKVKLSDELSSGIEWEGLFSVGKKYGMTYFGSSPFSQMLASGDDWIPREDFLSGSPMDGSVGAFPSTGTTTSLTGGQKVVPGEKMHIGIINAKRDFDALIKYLQTIGKTQVLSNPKLAVINNQEARIHVGERQAYVTTTTTTGQTTTTVSEEVTFVDVGIQLSVTPTINDDGFVTMKVKPEISSVVSTLITPSGNRIPIIDTSLAETTVMVKDGSTIVIGGLRREDKVSTSEGFPFLSKVPFLGRLFKTASDKTERQELLVMLTPHIVTGESLVTGDDRDFGTMPGKEYKDYPAFTSQTDYQPPKEAPEEKVRPYRQYMEEEAEEYQPTIKGEASNE